MQGTILQRSAGRGLTLPLPPGVWGQGAERLFPLVPLVWAAGRSQEQVSCLFTGSFTGWWLQVPSPVEGRTKQRLFRTGRRWETCGHPDRGARHRG